MFLDSDERYSEKMDSYEICRSFVKAGRLLLISEIKSSGFGHCVFKTHNLFSII